MNLAKLNEFLIKKNINIFELSKLSGVDDSLLYKLVKGKIKKPSNETIINIATALQLSEHEFAELCGYKNGNVRK